MLTTQQVHEVADLRRVEQAEPLREAEGVAISSDVPVGDGVEGTAAEVSGYCSGGLRAAARESISSAARRVNVRRRMRSAGTPRSSKQATREVRARVLPVPAPAITTNGARPCVATASCAVPIEPFVPSGEIEHIFDVTRRQRAAATWRGQTEGVEPLEEPVQLPSPCLLVLVGPGASGKSTWAAAHFSPDTIVSSDRLRALVGSGEDDISASEDAFALLNTIVERRLGAAGDHRHRHPGPRRQQTPRAARNGEALPGAVRGCHL